MIVDPHDTVRTFGRERALPPLAAVATWLVFASLPWAVFLLLLLHG